MWALVKSGKNIGFRAAWSHIKSNYGAQLPGILLMVYVFVVIPCHTAIVERGFNLHCIIKNRLRNSLMICTLDSLIHTQFNIICKHMFLPLQPVPPLPRRSTCKGYRQYPWKNWHKMAEFFGKEKTELFFRLTFLPVSMAAPGARFAFLRQAQKEKNVRLLLSYVFSLNFFF